jgi:hypothetical protein
MEKFVIGRTNVQCVITREESTEVIFNEIASSFLKYETHRNDASTRTTTTILNTKKLNF